MVIETAVHTAGVTASSVPNPARMSSPWLLRAAIVAVAAGAFGAMAWLAADAGAREVVSNLVRSPFGLAVLFGLAALSSATLILPAPGLALTALAATTADPLIVGIVAGAGQAVGELTGYAAGASGRSLLPDTPTIDRLRTRMTRRGAPVIFILALIPNPVFDIAGVIAGALHMPVSRYLAAAAAGKIIKNIAVAGGAATLGRLLGATIGG